MVSKKSYVKVFETKEVEVKKEVEPGEIIRVLEEMGERFDIDLVEMLKKVIEGKFDALTVEKDRPYITVHIGGLIHTVEIRVRTLDKRIEMRLPKSLDIFGKDG